MTLLPGWVSEQQNEGADRSNSMIQGAGKVPNAKKPKSRPPGGLRDKVGFLQGHLPRYSGPYMVGIMEIEVPAEEPRTFSNITRNKHHLLQLETVLMTVFYPAAFGSGNRRAPNGNKKWSGQTWLPRPRVGTAKGYGRFSDIGDFAVPWFAGTSMFTKLPVFRNAHPAKHWPAAGNLEEWGVEVKNAEGSSPDGESEEPCFPLMVFSHGLGGTRTTYSCLCGEFASYGFVACAVEHRDGSGPRTFVNHAKKGKGTMEKLNSTDSIDHTRESIQRGYDRIDYCFPKDNLHDTDPTNEKGIDRDLREAQIELRLAEIEEAYRVLCQICHGNGALVESQNLRQKGYIGSSSRGLEGIVWSEWKNKFHLDEVTVLGHSFGAAMTVEVLRETDRFNWVSQGIIYDIWGHAITPSEDRIALTVRRNSAAIPPPQNEPRRRIHAPILGINSEAFMYWSYNYDAVMSVVEEAQEQGAPTWLLTVRGTVHASQSDFSLLYPTIAALLLKATANPKRAIDINVNASLEFLKTVMPTRAKMIERSMRCEHILQLDVTEDLPTDHRPRPKWIAERLKIPHEFRNRVIPKLTRQIKRHTQDQEASDEVLMHVKPSKEEIEQYLVRKLEGKEHDGEASPMDKAPALENAEAKEAEEQMPDRPIESDMWSTTGSEGSEKSHNKSSG